MSAPDRPSAPGNSTAAVLWLMLLLVFAPIASAHLVARWIADEPPAQTETAAGPGAPAAHP